MRYARTGFQAGHFVRLGALIPQLLVDATRTATRHEGDDRLEAYRRLTLELTEAAATLVADSPRPVACQACCPRTRTSPVPC
ncbi:hypothetical protein [Streptomyces sp. NPDC092952]|uniref:hypothetical protein n=1 Tax=Streptomyces sp. NPDC092952 TaxID=3366018 RepID=UPI003811CAF7